MLTPKRSFMSFATLFLLSSNLYAQTEKTVVGVLPVSRGADIPTDHAEGVTDALANGFVKQKRFAVVDRMKINELNQERNLQKGESFIDGKVVEQGRSLGAEYLINSSVSSYVNDGEVCKMSVTCNVVDVKTGQIVESGVLELKGGNHGKSVARAGLSGLGSAANVARGGYAVPSAGNRNSYDGNAKDKAFRKTLSDMEQEIDEFVRTKFPVMISIAEISKKNKKGMADELLIAGGSGLGLKKGDKLKVVEIKEMEVDGKKLTRKVAIGQLSIQKVEDDNFSTCSVVNSTDDIAAKYESKANIKIIME